MINNKYFTFCVGCGLCKSMFKDVLEVNSHGFVSFSPQSRESQRFCKAVCPCFNVEKHSTNSIWGKYLSASYTFSHDSIIRKKGSSGGTITQIACFLLRSQKVDGVIHVKPSGPYSLSLCCSTTCEEVLENAGSKYIDSSNLINILDLVEEGKRYCFIGKPCEISILRSFAKINTKIANSICYYLSFFCAGVPSVRANKSLVSSLGCQSESCSSITYRGNGWPGETIVLDTQNKEYKCTYSHSWGCYLGRDVRKACRFCIDGIGELADISCADAWHVENGKPDFQERDGRNLTFARTEKGQELLELLKLDKSLSVEPCFKENDYLRVIQDHQFIRRASLYASILALKFCLKNHPNYDKKTLKSFAKYISLSMSARRFLGTLKRIIKGKI